MFYPVLKNININLMKFEALKHVVVIVQRTIVPPTERSVT